MKKKINQNDRGRKNSIEKSKEHEKDEGRTVEKERFEWKIRSWKWVDKLQFQIHGPAGKSEIARRDVSPDPLTIEHEGFRDAGGTIGDR